MTLLEIKKELRLGPYVWPGGYPRYFLTTDGAVLSFTAVRQEWPQVVGDHLAGHRSGWTLAAVGINYEDPMLYCDHTGERIESAYAD